MIDVKAPGDHRVSRLLNQIRWVTRLSVSLSSTQHIEDVYSVLLSGLLSPTGLGYSKVLMFEVDPATNQLCGKLSIGHESRESIIALSREMEEETAFLLKKGQDFSAQVEETPEAESLIHNLRLGSQWITLFQRLGPDNPETLVLSNLRYPLSTARSSSGSAANLLVETPNWRTPRICHKSECGNRIPPELHPLLADHFAIVPLITGKGMKGLIIVDRRYEEVVEFSPEDIEELAYFATQGVLAIANAELIEELGSALKDLRELDMLKSNFLSTISHELRTPLTAITGFVDLVLNERVGPLNETQKTLLARVAKNTAHLINMVNDLIEVTEIDASDKNEMILAPVDPLLAFFATLPKLEQRRRDKQGLIEPVIPAEGVPKIIAEERALSRVYFHVLDNALKFTQDNAPVRVAFREANGRLYISVSDQGIGIPRDKLQRIFDRFYQVDNSLTRSHEGLGLGLGVTKLLLQNMNATIQVESQVGHGTTVSMGFPLAPRESQDTPTAGPTS